MAIKWRMGGDSLLPLASAAAAPAAATTTAISHGQKRQPDDELDHEQRLSKRFNLLNLEQNGRLYIPVKSEAEASAQPSPPRRRRSNAVTDSMPVEDSKDRVFIHNLDEEIADIESDEEKIIFLPDIERHLMRIPKSVLVGNSNNSSSGPSDLPSGEMVLYSVPGSLSVPEDRDAVRKAIAETRSRAATQSHREDGSSRGNSKLQPKMNDTQHSHRYYDYDDAMDTE